MASGRVGSVRSRRTRSDVSPPRRSGDFERLWTLPASAEFFCGDGRTAAGHFALLAKLRREGRLDQVILFDRLDPEPPPADWQVRDRELAERLLAEWDRRLPLWSSRVPSTHGPTRPRGRRWRRIWPVSSRGSSLQCFDYASGHCWSRGEQHDVSGPVPDAPITLRLPRATPAVVPGRPGG